MTVVADDPPATVRTLIPEFYAEQNVFITGGTGFLGKVLVEKLLRSCPELSSIYLLVRPKKGKNVHKRLEHIFDDPIFARLKTERPRYRKKIVVVSGDCSLPNLGLSIEDRNILIHKISIVFHVAATVRFDEEMKYAVAINVSGTKEVMAICRSMNNLKAVIHVSTAYSNCNQLTIGEKFYPPPISAENVEKITASLDEIKLKKITPILLGDFPNTYCFTKAIAEATVKEHGLDLPCGIFRPAMVISTCDEPIKGWIDNIGGPNGGVAGVGAGLIRTLNTHSDCSAELIPVDLTVNALIATAWDIASNKNVEPQPPIYNYVATWNNKGITWGKWHDYALKYGLLYPHTRSMWYYVLYTTKYTMLYNLLTIILHIIPALILDTGLLITGQSPKMLKLYKKIHKFAEITSYFTRKTWKFHNDNTRELWDRLTAEDQKAFFFSMANFDWDSYMYNYIRGVRLYIFKDDPSTIPAARKRMVLMMVFHYMIKYTFLIVLLSSSYKLVSLILSAGEIVVTASVNENIAVVS